MKRKNIQQDPYEDPMKDLLMGDVVSSIDREIYNNDLYRFTKELLGYDQLDDSIHSEWCQNLQNNTSKRSLLLKPRGTFKSTVYSIGYPLSLLCRNPNIRILLVNSVFENAVNFANALMNHITKNENFIKVYGHLKDDEKWSAMHGFNISARTDYRKPQPNVTAVGVLGQLTSAHYDLIIADDIVNNDDRDSPTIRAKKKKWLIDLMSVLEPDGELLIVGTYWHFDDTYVHIEKNLNPKLKESERYMIEKESVYNEDGTARFRHLPIAALERLKIEKGPIEFSSQYLLSPLPAETQVFKQDEFITIDYEDVLGRVVSWHGAVDPSLGQSRTAAYSAIIVLGALEDGRLVILDADIERRSPDKTIEDVVRHAKRYEFSTFGVEVVQFQEMLKTALIDRCNREGLTLPVIELRTTQNKDARIVSLQPLFRQGQVMILADWRERYPLLIEQFVQYPLAFKDGPDAVEMAVSARGQRAGLIYARSRND